MSTEIEFTHIDNEYQYVLYRSKFENLCKDLFDNCFDPVLSVLTDAKLSKKDIDEVVLVGGSTRIPKVQEMLSSYFDGKKLNKSVNPDEAVAYGASIQGAILTNSDNTGKTRDLLLVDVIPLTLGIKTSGGIMTSIIHRNSSIPTSKTSMFTTIEDNQTCVDVEIYEGERKFVIDNHLLNKFSLTGIQKSIKGVPKIEVTFMMDANGILNVTASDKDSLSSNSVTIEKSNNGLSQDEIQNMIIDADKFKVQDEIKKDTIEFKNHFIQYLQNQQNIINASSDVLSTEDLSNANQLIINTMEWMHSPDENGVLPNLQQIKECRSSVEFYLKPALQQIYAISSLEENQKSLSKEAKQDLINSI
jgi:molecular chaperone DnaK (HSP70)